MAFSGGARYRPTTSVTLATSSGSVENLNVYTRQGATPYSRQALATVPLLTPRGRGSSRDDQCVTPSRFGGGRRVAAPPLRLSPTRGRPDRARSSSPSTPAAAYRARQPITV